MNGLEIRIRRTLRKDSLRSQEQSLIPRSGTLGQELPKLRRSTRYVVDDQVRHDLYVAGKVTDVLPAPQSRVDLRVINRVESGISTVDGVKERQQMNPFEQTLQRSPQNRMQLRNSPSSKPVYVGDQVDRISHALNSSGNQRSELTTSFSTSARMRR